MIILLDTCDFLWFVSGNPKLPTKTRQEIENPNNSVRLALLPSVHRDPLDRMLVCQAQEHSMHIASSDPIMSLYPVSLLS
jgi:PIN domain nuclease of toxin-antitoxin system